MINIAADLGGMARSHAQMVTRLPDVWLTPALRGC